MSAPDRIWAAPGKYGWADGLCGDWPSPGNPNDTAFLLETPARRHADELAEALREVKAMTDEAVKVPAAAERWLDRIEETCMSALANLEEET